MMSWLEASERLNAGDRVKFVYGWDIFPETQIDAGELATVVENGLNEMEPVLILRPDRETIRIALKAWDGNVWMSGPEDLAHDDNRELRIDSGWTDSCPLERVR